MSGIQDSFTGSFPFPHWDLLHDPQLFLCMRLVLSPPVTSFFLCSPFQTLTLYGAQPFLQSGFEFPKIQDEGVTSPGRGSEPLGPQLHPCLTFPDSPASSLLDLGEMPPVTLTAPLTRWVLFEEKLEVGADRWSAPHVPTVALPSLQKLRSLLAKGLVLLDCPALSLQELAGALGPFAGRAWASS